MSDYRDDYEAMKAALAERDARIAELEAQIASLEMCVDHRDEWSKETRR